MRSQTQLFLVTACLVVAGMFVPCIAHAGVVVVAVREVESITGDATTGYVVTMKSGEPETVTFTSSDTTADGLDGLATAKSHVAAGGRCTIKYWVSTTPREVTVILTSPEQGGDEMPLPEYGLERVDPDE